MNAMVLAAGRGTRLGALTGRVPKVLVEVGGEPMLARQLRYLREAGIARIVINTHHLADQVRAFMDTQTEGENVVVHEPALLGTAGGVRNALGHLGEEAFAVLYGDVLIEEPLGAVLATHRCAAPLATLAVYRTREVEGKGTVELSDESHTITAFHEKASSGVERDAYVNAGLYVVEPALLSGLPLGVPLDFGHDVFPAALAGGSKLTAHVMQDPVIDMGTPEMLSRARGQTCD